MSNISQEAVFFRPFDVRLLPLTPLRARKWEAFSSQGDFIFFPVAAMALPWGHKLEVSAIGQRCPNYPLFGEKNALDGAKVRATSPHPKALWHALIAFLSLPFPFSGQPGLSRISQLTSP